MKDSFLILLFNQKGSKLFEKLPESTILPNVPFFAFKNELKLTEQPNAP
jgi:hypothetical protein